jgi:hypothetical protein
MERGKATVDRTWSNALFFGWGSSNLVFRGGESGKVTLMTPWSIARAFFCRRCGTATIATDLTPPEPR